MSFFNDNFYEELDNNFEESEEDRKIYKEDGFAQDEVGSDINKLNQERFKNVVDNVSTKYDSYWDFNNPIVKIILIILFLVIVVGILYYVIEWIKLA